MSDRTDYKLPTESLPSLNYAHRLADLIVSGVKDDEVIAALEFDGTKHEFYLNDLLHFFGMADSIEKEDMRKEEVKFRLEIILKMFMLRYPYENLSKPSLIIS